MTTTEQLRTTTSDDPESPSRLRQAATTVRTSRPARAVSTHRKPVTVALLGLSGAALLLYLRKRNTKPTPTRFSRFRR